MGTSKHNRKIVLVADLVASRRIVERRAVQDRLKACLRQLNGRKREGLLSPYTITLGDEFQAVFSTPERIFRDALAVLIALHPVGVRFSCAIGEISTAINTKETIGMDGPAFHAARAMIDRLKKSRSLFALGTPDGAGLTLVNQSLALVSHLIRYWPRTRLVILLGLVENRTITQIAKHLRVTEQAVYKSIEAGALRTIVPLFGEITRVYGQRVERR